VQSTTPQNVALVFAAPAHRLMGAEFASMGLLSIRTVSKAEMSLLTLFA
jgi:hypothetical protein